MSRPADPRPARAGGEPELQRTRGVLRLVFRGAQGGATRLERLYQQGAARARLPAVPAGSPPEAVLINTAGGLTDGDVMAVEAEVSAGGTVTLTTQASEKVYRARSTAADTRIENRVVVGEGARLEWLPQETIVFDGARLHRSIEVDVAPGGSVLLSEAIVFGRTAMDERFRAGRVSDAWRVRRGARLAFADGLHVDGGSGVLARSTSLAGGCALATVLWVDADAERALEGVRAALASGVGAGATAGASAWNGMLVVRIAAADGAALRRVLVPALATLRGGRRLPTVWHC